MKIGDQKIGESNPAYEDPQGLINIDPANGDCPFFKYLRMYFAGKGKSCS
ncbi:unnamed protein product, partial [marine sediment metagenome]